MKSYKYIIFILILLQLSGCAIRTDMYVRDPKKVSDSPPKIITGQTALFWVNGWSGDAMMMDDWRSTGLFKDVVATNQVIAPTSGTYIKTTCDGYIDSHNDTGVLSLYGILTVASAGIIPAKADNEMMKCTTEFYQNGALLSTSVASYFYTRWWSSWVVLLFNPQDTFNKTANATISSHVVNTSLFDLKKKYP